MEGTISTIVLPEVDDTVRLGQMIGERLRAGDLVLLAGPLGAGKTALARGIGAGLGVGGRISSPTFVLAREHPAGPRGVPLVHVDAYRLGGSLAELDDLDLDSELTEAAVVVEWGTESASRLSSDYLLVTLERRPDDQRVATLQGYGCWPGRVAGLGDGPADQRR
ncbi:tRNA threonylcarbamoyladenosine biosynthesis protein TsaE [Tamaricihabitans halophyticus]|uniref:tRNA threonylcarbamoyladenosine biosynthesis protein TsaE n=1 Tax=Tamaricihabitans halophyticus TaxID=1262583 RepID=A0A4R2QTJ1_9PSEU|nr:tRNA (adenosine(37)-N6)-threonylcarbamoyltransferase complex ATPase subunit type 1 TsaE [Tamaricihabitans halophyticus]TCP53260.1 tRNA threonylcarbamoyladenosine biosynthesis protein TsaE [Tamaricihabitans halophyticus]